MRLIGNTGREVSGFVLWGAVCLLAIPAAFGYVTLTVNAWRHSTVGGLSAMAPHADDLMAFVQATGVTVTEACRRPLIDHVRGTFAATVSSEFPLSAGRQASADAALVDYAKLGCPVRPLFMGHAAAAIESREARREAGLRR